MDFECTSSCAPRSRRRTSPGRCCLPSHNPRCARGRDHRTVGPHQRGHGAVSCAAGGVRPQGRLGPARPDELRHWLNWQCGISRVAAREKVRTARALESLPKIAAAFGEGRLSYSKVRALTRAATAETEDMLLHIALNGTAAHVERTVRGFRRVQRGRERDEAYVLHERRYLDCRRDADGSVRVEARLSPEAGAMLLNALEVPRRNSRSGAAMRRAPGPTRTPRTPSLRHLQEFPRKHPRRNSRCRHGPMRFLQVFPRKHPRRRSRCRHGPMQFPQVFPRKHLRGASVSGARMHSSTSSGGLWPGRVQVRPPALTSWWVHIAHDALCDVHESSGASFENGRPLAVERLGGWAATGPWWAWL